MLMARAFFGVVLRDLDLARRDAAGSALALLFFILACVLIPLGVGPGPQLLEALAGGLVWLMALLAILLSLERLFQTDSDDGSLDQLLLAPLPAALLVLAKALAHWILTGLPLVVAAPVMAVLLNLPVGALPVLMLALLLGTPVLTLIGTVGAALTVGARRGGMLLALLVLPLYVPVLIMGSGAVESAVAGLPARPHLLILGAMLAAAIPACAWAGGGALRLMQD